MEEQEASRLKFSKDLPFQGRVKLKKPDVSLWLIEHYKVWWVVVVVVVVVVWWWYLQGKLKLGWKQHKQQQQ